MNTYDRIIERQRVIKSRLCTGLDTDISKLPSSMQSMDGMLEFNLRIIDATLPHSCCFKLNFAFYEQYGNAGMNILGKTIEAVGGRVPVIADAKRGDIGNTSAAYARSIFEYLKCDSVTINPLMGRDSVQPFLEYSEKLSFLLCLTSNSGSADFQRLVSEGEPLYKHIILKSKVWAASNCIGYVVGATHPDELAAIRKIVPNNMLLIPGVGAQGGDIRRVLDANGMGPAVINVSRDIIYASQGSDFASAAASKAEYYQDLMKEGL